MKARNTIQAVGVLALSGLAAPVWAHTGHGAGHGWLAGMMHPLGGLDHVLVMLGVGFWAGRLSGWARGSLPLAFLLMMALGAGLGFAGIEVPGAEGLIALSLPAIGLFCLAGARAARWPAALATAGFALVHGLVHAQEMPVDIGAASYAGGFLFSTALLLGLGSCLARVLAARKSRLGFGAIRAAG